MNFKNSLSRFTYVSELACDATGTNTFHLKHNFWNLETVNLQNLLAAGRWFDSVGWLVAVQRRSGAAFLVLEFDRLVRNGIALQDWSKHGLFEIILLFKNVLAFSRSMGRRLQRSICRHCWIASATEKVSLEDRIASRNFRGAALTVKRANMAECDRVS